MYIYNETRNQNQQKKENLKYKNNPCNERLMESEKMYGT